MIDRIKSFMINLGCLNKCRFSLVVKQMHGKHQRVVQFNHSAPSENLFELFERLI